MDCRLLLECVQFKMVGLCLTCLRLFALQVGYGNAAGCLIFITSYFGVIGLRRYFSDITLILIGMLSFALGIYFMTFVTATYMFYLGESECISGSYALWEN